jgi:hypothetical protein
MMISAVARSNRDVDRARALHREIKQIFELRPIREDARALEEVQRLCELAKATLDDSYCKDMMRALGACADCLSTADNAGAGEYASIQALIQSLLAVFEGRLQDLERNRRPAYPDIDARTGHGNRRRAQRRDYVTRPASAAAYPVCATGGADQVAAADE